MKIKICGLNPARDVQLCIDLGVNFLGFVFYKNSPRNLNLEDIHKLKKLRELNIYSVKSRDLKKIKELPSIESLTFRIFQITEELNPDKGESAHCPIMKEDSFSFLKNSKSLNSRFLTFLTSETLLQTSERVHRGILGC